MSGPTPVRDVDPFDLPDWLGESEVIWAAEVGVRSGHHVSGHLSTEPPDRARTAEAPTLACDLLAVDEAYPTPVADDRVRLRAHQAWRHGEILLVYRQERLTLAVPGTSFTADLVLEALGRLAKAVGASQERYAACLRIGADSPPFAGR